MDYLLLTYSFIQITTKIFYGESDFFFKPLYNTSKNVVGLYKKEDKEKPTWNSV